MTKPHRKGAMAMEKLATSSKYRTQFWYVAMASFLLWICLLYLFNSSATTVHNHERLFREDTTDLVVPKRHELDQMPLIGSDDSSVDNNSLPVTGGISRDQVLEDAKVVNDIVEELENEKSESEKKRGELISRARKGRRDSPLKETESRKSRSSSRFEADRKRIRRNVENNVESSENQSLDKEPNYFESKTKERVDKAFDGNNDEEQLKDFSEDVSEIDNDNVQQKRRSKRGKELTNDSDFEGDNSVELLQKDQRRKVSNRKNRPARSRRVIVRPRRTRANDPCAGKYVYMHEIPTLFNEELLKNCWTLSRWTDMCELTSNFGLGPRLSNLEGVSGWFATNQFTLEVIFHNRMKQYKCLTKDSSLASAVYVPYYPGLDLMRFLWGPFPTMRDAGALDLMKWLRKKPEWQKLDGRDHFMVAGRTTWDFMRTPGNDTDWGNRLMILPESKNMTMLLIESSPWNYHGFAVPYPTYFHPSSNAEILQWQNRMRRIRRRYLFSFVGAPRPNLGDSIRSEIMDQCKASRRKCKLLECVSGSQKCYKPDQIMKFFLSSTFCLQPPGDSYTRRSTFDSILAGCIPVFFHPGSAYAQYIWHLPKDIGKYSVFIPGKSVKEGKTSIERILSRIPRGKVIAMREEVIKLIPRLMYFNPSAKRGDTGRFEDAFDVAVQGVLERVEGIRRRMEEGKELFDFPEEFSWKYNVFGNVERHEWDSYFERP